MKKKSAKGNQHSSINFETYNSFKEEQPEEYDGPTPKPAKPPYFSIPSQYTIIEQNGLSDDSPAKLQPSSKPSLAGQSANKIRMIGNKIKEVINMCSQESKSGLGGTLKVVSEAERQILSFLSLSNRGSSSNNPSSQTRTHSSKPSNPKITK
jgi:hypothetical protein